MLFSGTVNTVAKKFQNESCSIGLQGDSHQFTHPWFQTMVMFLGETLCLLGFLAIRAHRRRMAAKGKADQVTKHAPSQEALLRVNSGRLYEEGERTPLLTPGLLEYQEAGNSSSTKTASTTAEEEDAYLKHPVFQPLFILPMLCDLCGTTLGGIGLLFISASVWQVCDDDSAYVCAHEKSERERE
jgi:hypothetical protein